MSEVDNNKVALRFWIGALAFSTLLLATTFALMASYLADIRSNTSAALVRTDLVNSRLNTLDSEISTIHRHIVEQKVNAEPSELQQNAATNQAPVVAPLADQGSAAPLVKDITPAEMNDSAAALAKSVTSTINSKPLAVQPPALAVPPAAPVAPSKP